MVKEFTEQFEKIDLSRQFGGVRLPNLKIEQEDYDYIDADNKIDNAEFLKKLTINGMQKRLESGRIDATRMKEYSDRAKLELATFTKLHFTDYVLIVWDVIRFCEKNGIATGVGRGSVCGSLVFYLIGCTEIDPIKYDLYFQRFVSEYRAKSHEIDGVVYLDGSLMCDVDLDIDYLRRHEVVEYLAKKYPNRTSKILNLTTLTGKALIKDAGKIVAEKSEHEMNEISNYIESVFGNVQDIANCYKENEKFKNWCDTNRKVYDVALRLRDLIKNKSVHASGLVISYEKLDDICPVELTSDKELVSGFSMYDVLQFCVKLDLLGLKTVTQIDQTCRLAGLGDYKVNVPFEEDSTYTPLTELLYAYGIFQLAEPTGFKVTNWVQPNSLPKTSDVMAMARPGAMQSVGTYVDNGKKGKIEGVHPVFEEILSKTNGVPLYQEQLMAMSHAVGFSLDEAEIIRRIVGKKDREAVKSWQEKVYKMVEANQLPKSVADFLWDTLNKSKDYSFNKSHSMAYAAMAGITTYLKFNHPKEFFLVALRIARIQSNTNERIERIASEAKYFGVELLPPDLSIANEDFIIEGNAIRFGLSSVKGVSEKKLVKLRQFTSDNPNKFQLFESAHNAKVDIGTFGALIQAGALSKKYPGSRSRLVLEAQLWNLLNKTEKTYCLENGDKYNYDVIEMVKVINTWTKGGTIEAVACPQELALNTVKKLTKAQEKALLPKPVAKATRLDTLREKYQPYKKIYEQNSKYEEFANWWYERALLGFSYSTSLKKIFQKACHELISIDEFADLPERNVATFVAKVDKITESVTKNKKRYNKIIFSDGTGQLMSFLWEPKRTDLKAAGKIPEEGQIVAFKGKKLNGAIHLDDLSPQSHKIFLKLSDMKLDQEHE